MEIEAIFFDAAGTLVELAQPVGLTYAQAALECGLLGADDEALPERTERAFRQSMQAAGPLAFQVSDARRLERLERNWWRQRAAESMPDMAAQPEFDNLFQAVYEHYSRAQAWRLAPGCLQLLDELASRGLILCVVSNFDSRLDGILAQMGILDRFRAVVASSRVGAAKPDPRIFQSALRIAGAAAGATLHVGDSLRCDYRGALAAGLIPVLYDREGKHIGEANRRISRLTHLLAYLV